VDCAINGREALEPLRNSQSHPSAIILKVLMPEMDGWQFRAEQKKDARIAGIPVIVVTAMRDTEEFDAAAILHKPVSVPVLLAAVAHLRSGAEAN
jgi:CheY-like chemotaxis protein